MSTPYNNKLEHANTSISLTACGYERSWSNYIEQKKKCDKLLNLQQLISVLKWLYKNKKIAIRNATN